MTMCYYELPTTTAAPLIKIITGLPFLQKEGEWHKFHVPAVTSLDACPVHALLTCWADEATSSIHMIIQVVLENYGIIYPRSWCCCTIPICMLIEVNATLPLVADKHNLWSVLQGEHWGSCSESSRPLLACLPEQPVPDLKDDEFSDVLGWKLWYHWELCKRKARGFSFSLRVNSRSKIFL